ncbi:MAG: DUF933 domain-containing protein [Deltaproteobacteria bacterium]|nr:DUF933 domain-containing protein [Deltaproteobacteria bacterium]
MDATIIGLAHTGKTTLLSALSGHADAAEIATVRVPDARVDELGRIFETKKIVYAEIRAREAAWPGSGESSRRSETEHYLNAIKGSRLFLHVVAAARTPMMADEPDPARDLAKLDGEMIFSDLVTIDRILERAKKVPLDANVKSLLERLHAHLEGDVPLFTATLAGPERAQLAGFNLVTLTPQLIVINTTEDAPDGADAALLGDRLFGRHVVGFPFTLAREVSLLPAEEQDAFAKEMGLDGTAAARLAREAFAQLDLISFLTAGDKECRAWPITRGTTAREAAGEVHSDIERGFIRAETVAYPEFVKRGSMKACRDDGILRLEGKDYLVQDGDVLVFRFNV